MKIEPFPLFSVRFFSLFFPEKAVPGSGELGRAVL